MHKTKSFLIPADSPYAFESAFPGGKKKYSWNLILFVYVTNTQTYSPLTSYATKED